MNSYFSIEQQQVYKAQATVKIAIAWFLGAFAIWMWANQQDAVRNFWYVYWAFVGAIKILGFLGWIDFAKSKGYGIAAFLLGFVPVFGPGALVMMDDRWGEQEAPKLKVRQMSW